MKTKKTAKDTIWENIDDEEKYIDIDFKLLSKILNKKSELKKVLKHDDFNELSKKLITEKSIK